VFRLDPEGLGGKRNVQGRRSIEAATPSAEGARIEAPRGWSVEGVPLPTKGEVWAVPLPRNFFFNFRP